MSKTQDLGRRGRDDAVGRQSNIAGGAGPNQVHGDKDHKLGLVALIAGRAKKRTKDRNAADAR